MSDEKKPGWQMLFKGHDEQTDALGVPGGTLYRSTQWGFGENLPQSESMAFVPWIAPEDVAEQARRSEA